MNELEVLLRSDDDDAWQSLGHKPFKGLPHPGNVIEMDKKGAPYLYRVISAHPPDRDGNGHILVSELGSREMARRTLFSAAMTKKTKPET